MPVQQVQPISLDLWRHPIAPQDQLASLVLTTAQTASDHQDTEIGDLEDCKIGNRHKVRKYSLCRCLPILRAVANNQILHIIIDTGATINLINTNIAKAMHTRAATESIMVSDISSKS